MGFIFFSMGEKEVEAYWLRLCARIQRVCYPTLKFLYQGDKHHRNFFYFFDDIDVFVGQYFKHEGFQGIEATVDKNTFDEFNRGFVVFGEESHFICSNA